MRRALRERGPAVISSPVEEAGVPLPGDPDGAEARSTRMIAWLSRLFDPRTGADEPAPTAQPFDRAQSREDLRALRVRRRQLINNVCSLRAYGFDTIAQDDEAALKSLEKKILTLQLKSGATEDQDDAGSDFT
jgi:hypothetical protein